MTAAAGSCAERLPGWEARLHAVVEDARRRPYALGVHDCFRVACEAMRALTGVDRWSLFAGRYATRREALRLIGRHGRSVDEAGSWLFGGPVRPAAEARRGDVVKFVDAAGEAHLGVCLGAKAAVLGEAGLGFVPLGACAGCWRIG